MTASRASLTPAQLDEIREQLQRTLMRLERSMKLSGNGRPPEIDQSAVGRLSRIEALHNAGLTRNLQDREKQQLEEVLAALHRLEEGTYGRCTSCGASIRIERLLVVPETRTCGECGSS